MQGSLPWAVAQANSDTSGRAVEIDFSDEAFDTGQGISLQGPLVFDNTTPGESIIVEGPASGLNLIGGGANDPFSDIVVDPGTTVSLVGLEISNGDAISGAGIANYGTLSLSLDLITGNTGSFQGGGINNTGTLTVTNSTISDNYSGAGGGIFNSGTATFDNVMFLDNTAAELGGAICNPLGSTLTVTGATISGNTITDVYGVSEGGGIYNYGTATVSGSTLENNSADDGGAIYNIGTVTVLDDTFTNNAASSDGGGIYSTGNITDSDSSFADNTAGSGSDIDAVSGTLAFGDTNGCNTYTVTSSSIVSSEPDGFLTLYFDVVTYGDLQSLTLSGQNGDVFNVLSTSVPTILNDSVNCTFNIGNGNLNAVQGSVAINFQTGSADSVVLNDSSDASPGNYIVTSSSVTASGFGGLTYQNVQFLTLDGAPGSTYTVDSTSASTTLYLNGSGTLNTYEIGDGNLNNLPGPVEVNGAGADSEDLVELFDYSDSTAQTYIFASNCVSATGAFGGLTYSNVGSIFLSGGSGADTYGVQSNSVGISLEGNGPDSTYDIGDGNLAALAGNVNVFAGGGNVVVDDQSASFNGTYTVTGYSVSRPGFGIGPLALYYLNAQSLTLEGASGTEVYDIQSTSALTTINAGTGNATFNVGSAAGATGSLSGIQGAVTLNGGTGNNTLNFFDEGETSGQSYTLTPSSLTRAGIATVGYATVENVVLNTAGSGGSTVDLTGDAGVTTSLDGNGADNTLVGPNLANTWNITGTNAGTVAGYAFKDFQNLTGGSVSDTFVLAAGASQSGIVSGGGGTATLDYAAQTAALTINLANLTATHTGGIENITAVIGSSSTDNTLVGATSAIPGISPGPTRAPSAPSPSPRSPTSPAAAAATASISARPEVSPASSTARRARTLSLPPTAPTPGTSPARIPAPSTATPSRTSRTSRVVP